MLGEGCHRCFRFICLANSLQLQPCYLQINTLGANFFFLIVFCYCFFAKIRTFHLTELRSSTVWLFDFFVFRDNLINFGGQYLSDIFHDASQVNRRNVNLHHLSNLLFDNAFQWRNAMNDITDIPNTNW